MTYCDLKPRDLLNRIRWWAVRKLVGGSPTVMNVEVFGGMRLGVSATGSMVQNVELHREDPRHDPYQWFTPMRGSEYLIYIEGAGVRVSKDVRVNA